MPRERFALIGLAALVVVGLIFVGVSSGISAGQRDAWMQGYTMGRLTAAAGAEGAAAPVVPNAAAYAVPYAVGYQPHGPGFGGFFFLLLGAGALFFFISRMIMMARWRTWAAMQGGQHGWPQGGPQGGPQSDWHHGPPPWMRGRWGCGPSGAQWEQAQQAQQQAQQSGQAQQPQAAPSQAPEQPAAER
jgi:hypothetical protein